MVKRTIHLGNACRLSVRLDQLIIQYNHISGQENMPDRSVPLEDIAVLVLEHEQIIITHPLLSRLAEHNVAVVCCNDKKHPVGMLLNLCGHSVQSERFRAQIEASEPLKKQLWQQTVKAKIANQAALLQSLGKNHQYLFELQKNVRSGDADNAEAKAAFYYWQRLFPPEYHFYREPGGPPPNNLLNYGYAILRALTARALVGSGLLPTLGIFHRNRYNAYCLADDIMEPYRVFVDQLVVSMVLQNPHIDQLTKDIKTRLLQIPQLDVLLEDKKIPLMIAMSRTTASLAQCFTGNSRKIIYPQLCVPTD